MATVQNFGSDRWDDEEGGASAAPFKVLSREEVASLRARNPSLSPWRVVGAQGVLGVLVALFAALITGSQSVAWSALYGAVTVVLPSALMARGMTSKLSSMSPGAGAVSFMSWEFVKIGVSVSLLLLAPKLVQPLSWPALLVGMALCMQVYWLALMWRGR
jgi:ATP synthase protein I